MANSHLRHRDASHELQEKEVDSANNLKARKQVSQLSDPLVSALGDPKQGTWVSPPGLGTNRMSECSFQPVQLCN